MQATGDNDGELLAEAMIAVPAEAGHLGEVHALLDRFWAEDVDPRLPTLDPSVRIALVTAIGEIAANIVRHAYAGSPPAGMELRLMLFPDRVAARFTDNGKPFVEPPPGPAPADVDPIDLLEGGYGLAIARAALDDLVYRRLPSDENQWTLVKRLGSREPMNSHP